jgi:topoisomerase-4 subunit B
VYLSAGIEVELFDERGETPVAGFFLRRRSFFLRSPLEREKRDAKTKISFTSRWRNDVEVGLQYNGLPRTVHCLRTILRTQTEEPRRVFGAHIVPLNATRETRGIKEKDKNLNGEDVREGLTAVSVKIPEPQFRTNKGKPEIRSPNRVESICRRLISLKSTRKTPKRLSESVLLRARRQRAARETLCESARGAMLREIPPTVQARIRQTRNSISLTRGGSAKQGRNQNIKRFFRSRKDFER